MNKPLIILVVVIITLLILIAIFNNYDSSPTANYYSQLETEMRKLWY